MRLIVDLTAVERRREVVQPARVGLVAEDRRPIVGREHHPRRLAVVDEVEDQQLRAFRMRAVEREDVSTASMPKLEEGDDRPMEALEGQEAGFIR